MKHGPGAILCLLVMAGSAAAQAPKPSAAILPQAADPSQERTQQELTPSATSTQQGLAPRATNGTALPAGTAIRIKLAQTLSTRKNIAGDRFEGRITEAVALNGRTVVPAGSGLSGRIERVSEPRRFAGHPSLRLRPERVVLPGGENFALDASVVDSGAPRQTKVSTEGRISGPSTPNNDKIEVVALSGTGAVAGAVVAGPVGSLAGALAGATVSGGHAMMKRRSLELPAGTVLILELNSPLQITTRATVATAQGE